MLRHASPVRFLTRTADREEQNGIRRESFRSADRQSESSFEAGGLTRREMIICLFWVSRTSDIAISPTAVKDSKDRGDITSLERR